MEGLVDGKMLKIISSDTHDFLLHRLTWSGHEFLDCIRSNSVWNKTKQVFVSEGIGMTVDLIKSVATGVASKILKGAIGG